MLYALPGQGKEGEKASLHRGPSYVPVSTQHEQMHAWKLATAASFSWRTAISISHPRQRFQRFNDSITLRSSLLEPVHLEPTLLLLLASNRHFATDRPPDPHARQATARPSSELLAEHPEHTAACSSSTTHRIAAWRPATPACPQLEPPTHSTHRPTHSSCNETRDLLVLLSR